MIAEKSIADLEETHSDIYADTTKDDRSKVSGNDGPYWQMIYYAFVGFFFTNTVLTQLPLISEYFGGTQVLFYLLFFYCISANLIRLYLIWNYGKYPSSIGSRIDSLVYVGASMTAVTIILYPLSMIIFGKENPTVGFWVCLGLATMAGVFNSLVMNAGFGLMSLAPQKSAMFFLIGLGVAPMVSWPMLMVMTIIVSRIGGGDKTNFIVGVTSLSLAALLTLGLIPLYRYKTRYHPVFAPILIGSPGTDISTKSLVPSTGGHKDMFRVMRKILVPSVCLWLIMLLTFDVYPSQISLWSPSVEDAPYAKDTYQSFLIYIFAVADTVGRICSKRFVTAATRIGKKFIGYVIFRGLLLCPLIILSSIVSSLSADWLRLMLILLLGVTHGIGYSVSAMAAPSMVDASDKLNVGSLLSFAATNGNFVGSLIGIGLKFALVRD